MKGIIFDVDGTLWDSTREVAVAWNKVLQDEMEGHEILTAEGLQKEFGKPMDAIAESLFPEMSEKDKEIMQKLAESGEIKVKDLREQLEMSSEQFSVYRERLKRKGVIDTRKYGKISMALPRFEDFIKMRMF